MRSRDFQPDSAGASPADFEKRLRQSVRVESAWGLMSPIRRPSPLLSQKIR
jgi:hypothetical protein